MWGETTESASRSNLRKALQQLRNHLGDYLTITRNTVAMAENAHYWVDVVNFNTALQPSSSDESIRGLVRATDLYQGDFLDGFLVRDAPEFENWWLAERASLRERMLDSLQTLADHYGARRNFDLAISLTRRFLEMEPWREEAHRRLMILLAQNGHRSAALAQYEICREMLVNELGIEPAQETAHLYEQIRTEAIASPLISIPLHPPHRPKDNLPHPLTAFIGRQEEMEKITALISDHRLITLVGSGGIGKTELCLRLGKTLLDTFSDGVWLVELAPITDPAFIPHTIASALGMWESSASSIADRLLEYLNSRQCLIILDNCEHLTTQAAQFAKTILQNCPDIKLLVTSREILGIPGERQFRLLPLSFPQGKSTPDFAEWHRYDAVAMFVNCVTAKSPDFQVTRNNIIPIVNICQQLDGIPLALELAAAQVNIFTVEQIAARLDDRFSLLSSGNRTALPRQQTLHASIEWGWELLSTSEKMTMMRLAVFVGEATLQAVDEICGGDGVVSSAVVNILGKLVNKSLVVVTQEQNQELWYRLLESIRQYAWSELVDAGFEIKICDRHLDYYNKLGNQAEKELTGPNQATWLKLLEREIGNIRAALNWALKTNTEKGLELATSLWRFWTHSYVIEGDTWLSRFLTDADQNRSAIRAKALWVQSRINFFSLQNFDRAQVLVEESLALYRELGNQQGIGRCLGLHGWGIGRNGILCFEESLTILRSIGDKLGLADVLILLGYYEWQNDNVRAMVYLDECIYLYRELEHLAGVADALDIIGQFEVWKGNFETARPLAEESLALRELLGLRGQRCYFYSAWRYTFQARKLFAITQLFRIQFVD